LTTNKSFKKTFTKVPDWLKDVVEVKQVLTWETAAVKRIQQVSIGSGQRPGGTVVGQGDGIGMGGMLPMGGQGAGTGQSAGLAHSVKTLPKGLFAIFQLKAKAEGGGGGGALPMDGGMPGGPGVGVPGGPGGGAPKDNTISENGFDFKRYVKIAEEESANQTARRVPVAVVLVIDQNHLARVLTSFANSKLRFKTEQVLWNRYPKPISPLKHSQPPGYGPGGIDGLGGYNPAAFDPMYGGYPPGGYPPGGMPPGPGGSGMYGGTPYQDGGLEGTSAHLEVVIYGIVSLYERFPPRPAAEAPPAG
jgi:hypothetical protein